MRVCERERHKRPVEGYSLFTRFFNTYWQLRKRSDPCVCASCVPLAPHRQGRSCDILDNWLRSGRRSGRRVAGTQHAVATPFLNGPGRRSVAGSTGTRGAPVESRPGEYHHRSAGQAGHRTERLPVRVKAPINRHHPSPQTIPIAIWEFVSNV